MSSSCRSRICLPIMRPSSTSKCTLTPLGRRKGPSFGRSIELGGLVKKNGCFGRALLSSLI